MTVHKDCDTDVVSSLECRLNLDDGSVKADCCAALVDVNFLGMKVLGCNASTCILSLVRSGSWKLVNV